MSRVHVAKGGKRKDLKNKYFRSKAEANYARYLNFMIAQKQVKKWEYEPVTIYFPIKRGNNHYCPDFKVYPYRTNRKPYFVEVKGYMDRDSAVRLRRFAKFCPEEILEVVRAKDMLEIRRKVGALIPGWE